MEITPESPTNEEECVIHDHPVPPEEIKRYSVSRDPAAEQDIANYVQGQARDETIQHVERVKLEYVLGEAYEIWDVTTDQDRWWVVTNLTNLYSQKHFPSLDYTLSFHIGLMMRIRSRPEGPDSSDPDPFDEVFRRGEHAKFRFDRAVEAEDYQAVGMQLRECLITLVTVLRRRIPIPTSIEKPQDANFTEWITVLLSQLCPGKRNEILRKYVRVVSEKTWQLVNWLTHDRNANKTASSIAIDSCDMVVGQYIQLLQRNRTDRTDTCPQCSSRNIRSHFDIAIEPDGAYYDTCAVCGWSSHPVKRNIIAENESNDQTKINDSDSSD